jgi:hypothetical protein
MTWVFLVMLGMIVGSVVIERILPQRVKDRLGSIICWGMMALTMSCLALAGAGLVWVTISNYVLPFFA